MGFVVGAALSGCACEEPTDEERLRDQLDTTKVHLYVAAKIALGNPEANEGAAVVRRELLRAIEAAASLSEGDDPHGLIDVVNGQGGLQLDGASVDVVQLATALWELRASGRDQVRRWGDEDVPPVLPTLMTLRSPEPVEQLLDPETEHAALMLVYFLAKFHPDSPVPLADELLLYEGYVTDADAIPAGMAPLVRAIRAYLYATNSYCDLAVVDGRALDEVSDEQARRAVASAIEGLGLASTEQGSRAGTAGLGALAHVSTASCYVERGDRDAADDELRRFCDAAERSGAPPEELALLRAYLAIRAEDFPAARRSLELARTREGITDAERADLDRLIAHLDDEDRSFVDAYFDKAFFAGWALHYTLARLEEAGLLEALAGSPLYRNAMSMMIAVTATLHSAQGSVPSFEEAREEGAGWFERWLE